MLKPRMRAELLGLVLIGLSSAPAVAQTWPSDSGPTGDYLGATLRQFERLAPPPIESEGRGERAVPDMPLTDLPSPSVDVGMPSMVTPVRPVTATARAGSARRGSYRRARTSPGPSRAPLSREARLERELARQNQRILELERQIQQGR